MYKALTFSTIVGLAIGFLLSQMHWAEHAHSQENKEAKRSIEPNAVDAELKGITAAFEKAFNSADAKTIAAQFTENAEIVDADGDVVSGRTSIQTRFAEIFQNYPDARITIELTSLRQLSSDVAVEDGFSSTKLMADDDDSRSPYTMVYVKRDGAWLVARVRDFPEEPAEATAHTQLKGLEWLVGEWFDEAHDGVVHTNCRWSEDGNYLLQDFAVKTRHGPVLQGSQRFAWDPVKRTIRSWAFDQSGAFAEASWTAVDDYWVVRTEGFTPAGQGISATRFVRPLSDDSYRIDSTNQTVGNELLPDRTVIVVRRPPAPVQ